MLVDISQCPSLVTPKQAQWAHQQSCHIGQHGCEAWAPQYEFLFNKAILTTATSK